MLQQQSWRQGLYTNCVVIACSGSPSQEEVVFREAKGILVQIRLVRSHVIEVPVVEFPNTGITS